MALTAIYIHIYIYIFLLCISIICCGQRREKGIHDRSGNVMHHRSGKSVFTIEASDSDWKKRRVSTAVVNFFAPCLEIGPRNPLRNSSFEETVQDEYVASNHCQVTCLPLSVVCRGQGSKLALEPDQLKLGDPWCVSSCLEPGNLFLVRRFYWKQPGRYQKHNVSKHFEASTIVSAKPHY